MPSIPVTFGPAARLLRVTGFAAVMLTGFPPTAALAEPNAAWVQLLGPGGAPTVRVITSEASCPALRADDEDVAMQVRAGPGPLFPADGNKTKRPPFPVTVCEATLKPGTAQAVIDRPNWWSARAALTSPRQIRSPIYWRASSHQSNWTIRLSCPSTA